MYAARAGSGCHVEVMVTAMDRLCKGMFCVGADQCVRPFLLMKLIDIRADTQICPYAEINMYLDLPLSRRYDDFALENT